MGELLNLARAARLVGVPRTVLQKRIQRGELPSFDGLVSVTDLRVLFPDARLELDEAFERLASIKEQAFGRRVRERALPSQEILGERVFEQSRELADVKLHLQHYHALVLSLRQRIDALASEAPPPIRASLQELAADVDAQLAQLLSDSEQPVELAVMSDMLKVMSAHVTIHPSGRDFLVDGADTVLEAGLKAGLALNYGCSNGNCGLCKARVVSGSVRAIRHHDYVFTEAEKSAGYFLPCSCAPVADLVVEALSADGPEDIPEQQIVARVRAVKPLSDTVMLLHLQTPRSNRLRFLAGQRVALGFHPAGSAEFPVASCPCDDRNLHFHIERDPQLPFSDQLFAGHLKVGDSVSVWGPWGDFVLDGNSPRPLIFVACDTAFAPVKSLIEHAIALDSAPAVHLYWLASPASGHYLANLCRSWSAAFDEFRFTPLDAASADDDPAAAAQTLTAITSDLGDQLGACDIYLAGSAEFTTTLTALLSTHGVVSEQIRTGAA